MKINNASDIKEYNKNKCKDLYKKVIECNFPNHIKCKKCNDVIYYENSSSFYLCKKTNKVKLNKLSYLTTKKIQNNEFTLKFCEQCVKYKHDEYNLNINRNKWFNTWNILSFYAFDVSEEYQKLQSSLTGVTLKNLIRKYGEKVGSDKWKVYCDKQSKKNTFEFKKEKYGWNEEQFKTFNLSRAITIDNCIKKYGELEGLKRWSDYVYKQQFTKSKEYYVLKYGEEAWKNLCKKKSHTIENYINIYGDFNTALKKLNDFHNKTLYKHNNSEYPKCVSMSSQKYFILLEIELKLLKPDIQLYYFEKDKKEYMKYLNGSLVYLDFYIKDYNICIEFNGDLYHGNPKIFNKDDKPIPHMSDITCEEIWKNDKKRIDELKRVYDIDTLIIWESELPRQKEYAKIIYEKYEKL